MLNCCDTLQQCVLTLLMIVVLGCRQAAEREEFFLIGVPVWAAPLIHCCEGIGFVVALLRAIPAFEDVPSAHRLLYILRLSDIDIIFQADKLALQLLLQLVKLLQRWRSATRTVPRRCPSCRSIYDLLGRRLSCSSRRSPAAIISAYHVFLFD